jgi:hypothetical protein
MRLLLVPDKLATSRSSASLDWPAGLAAHNRQIYLTPGGKPGDQLERERYDARRGGIGTTFLALRSLTSGV